MKWKADIKRIFRFRWQLAPNANTTLGFVTCANAGDAAAVNIRVFPQL